MLKYSQVLDLLIKRAFDEMNPYSGDNPYTAQQQYKDEMNPSLGKGVTRNAMNNMQQKGQQVATNVANKVNKAVSGDNALVWGMANGGKLAVRGAMQAGPGAAAGMGAVVSVPIEAAQMTTAAASGAVQAAKQGIKNIANPNGKNNISPVQAYKNEYNRLYNDANNIGAGIREGSSQWLKSTRNALNDFGVDADAEYKRKHPYLATAAEESGKFISGTGLMQGATNYTPALGKVYGALPKNMWQVAQKSLPVITKSQTAKKTLDGAYTANKIWKMTGKYKPNLPQGNSQAPQQPSPQVAMTGEDWSYNPQ